MPNDGVPLFSRNGTTSAGGKKDRRLDIPVDEDLEEKLIALAVMRGVPKAEYARLVLERHVYGELAVVAMVSGRGTRGDGN